MNRATAHDINEFSPLTFSDPILKYTSQVRMSRDRAVGIATGYGLDDRGVGVGVSVGSRPAPGPTQPPILWVPEALSLGVKRPGREADHSN
jgi:hypothetical protein